VKVNFEGQQPSDQNAQIIIKIKSLSGCHADFHTTMSLDRTVLLFMSWGWLEIPTLSDHLLRVRGASLRRPVHMRYITVQGVPGK